MKQDIKFGFWNYAESGKVSPDSVKEWKEMGINLPMSCVFDVEKDNKKDMLDMLDACLESGMQLIICDMRTSYKTYQKKGVNAFTQGVKEAYADFGWHKGAFGFFVGDEPTLDEQEEYIETLKIVIREMPNLIPFGNLVPYWGGCDFDSEVGRQESFFVELVDNLLAKSQTPLIAYDQYTQCLQENQNMQMGIDSYFYGLDMFYKATKKQRIPFYISLLSVGHWGYRVPTEDDIRWQIYTALAHGARGIIWFYFYQTRYEESFRNAPYYAPLMKKTELFDIISRQQNIFHAAFKEQFDKMEMTDVYHLGHMYNSGKRFCKDDTIENIQSKFAYPIIITYYKEFNSEKRWVSIVNGHQRFANQITVQFADGKGEKTSFWLAPGEMKLLAVE